MAWIVKGILVGFAFGIFIGPVFFIYLQTAVKRGFKYGLMVGLGVWSADLFLVSIMNFNLDFIKSLLATNNLYFWFSIISGLILILMGLYLFSKKGGNIKSIEEAGMFEDEEPVKKNKYTFYALAGRGFIVNFLQPFVIFYWLGVSINLTFKQQAMPMDKFMFFGGALLTRMSLDFVKIFLGKSIKSIVTTNRLVQFQRISGAILLIFGIVLISKAWTT